MGGSYLIEGDGGAYGGFDATDLDAEVTKYLYDTVFIGSLFLHVYVGLTVIFIFLQQVESGVVIVLKLTLGVIGLQFLVAHLYQCTLAFCSLIALGHFYLEIIHFISLFAVFARFADDVRCIPAVTVVGNRLTFFREFYGLRLGIVKGVRVFHYLVLIAFKWFSGVIIGHLELHPIKYLTWIQYLTNDIDGFSAEIGEKCDRRQSQYGGKARCPEDVFNDLADI